MIDWTGCTNDGTPTGIPTADCLIPLFQTIVTYALIFAGVVLLFLIIWAGLRYIQSGGDPKKVDTARKTLTYAILGLIIVFLAFTIINFISYITDVQCLNLFGFEACG